jgi:hypothetical protein
LLYLILPLLCGLDLVVSHESIYAPLVKCATQAAGESHVVMRMADKETELIGHPRAFCTSVVCAWAFVEPREEKMLQSDQPIVIALTQSGKKLWVGGKRGCDVGVNPELVEHEPKICI